MALCLFAGARGAAADNTRKRAAIALQAVGDIHDALVPKLQQVAERAQQHTLRAVEVRQGWRGVGRKRTGKGRLGLLAEQLAGAVSFQRLRQVKFPQAQCAASGPRAFYAEHVVMNLDPPTRPGQALAWHTLAVSCVQYCVQLSRQRTALAAAAMGKSEGDLRATNGATQKERMQLAQDACGRAAAALTPAGLQVVDEPLLGRVRELQLQLPGIRRSLKKEMQEVGLTHRFLWGGRVCKF